MIRHRAWLPAMVAVVALALAGCSMATAGTASSPPADVRVIGIPTLAATDPQLGGGAAAGIGFAIPSNTVRDIAGQLTSQGKVTNSHRAFLGVEVAGTTSGGLLITEVQLGGPAAKAGIRAGELVTSVDGTATPDPATLADVLVGLRPGQTVRVEVARPGGPRRTVRVTLGQYPG